VTSIRLSVEELNKFKEIAKNKGLDFNTLVREALTSYTGVLERPQLPQNIEKLLGEFQERVNEYIGKIKQFCEEHAKIVTENHEKERDKYNYWRDMCLHRHRRITYNTLKIYAEKHIISKVNAEDKNELEKRIREIIDKAVNDIYPSQYPPLYQ
jgi:predicted DNA-binding protein